jgi:GPH family glycoside/pentoside/hexuronide:cation symporter
MSEQRVAAPPVRRLGRGTITAYAVGAVAYGVKDAGFGTFLLSFYNQVMGLPYATVGLVIMAALLIDAAVDPLVGFLSDRTGGRWGRRHPWMYASALPIAGFWVLLWNPPAAASPTVMLAWLFACAVAVRTAVSAYEVPSVALTPELSGDYDERTRIMAWRYLFGWAGGLAMGLAAWLYFLKPAAGEVNGLLNRDGYRGYALAGAGVMLVAILVSAAGTHRQIPLLPKRAAERRSLGQDVRALGATVRNRPFALLMLASLAAYTNQGVIYALGVYLNTYVWRFSNGALVASTAALFLSATAAFVLAPVLGRRLGKPGAAWRLAVAGACLQTAPYWLRLAGLFPDVGTSALVPTVIGFQVLATTCSVSAFILGASMMADVVEESEARTGVRSEGVFFAGAFFVQKCTSGVGIFLATAILTAAGFPERAVPGKVDAGTLDRLVTVFGAGYLVLALCAAFLFARFPFGRAEHEARLALGAAETAPRA